MKQDNCSITLGLFCFAFPNYILKSFWYNIEHMRFDSIVKKTTTSGRGGRHWLTVALTNKSVHSFSPTARRLALQFCSYFISALVYPTATAVLSFKPSAIKQQKIPYPISSWLQLSASVIPLLCTRLSELPPPLYECALGGKWAYALSVLTFLRR